MENFEKKLKEIVHTGLGAISALKQNFDENKQKAAEFLTNKQADLKKFFDELELKGQTDQDEMSKQVREKLKDIFKSLHEYQTKMDEFAEENFANLRLEMSKHNINLPELDEIKSNVKKTLDEGKSKLGGVVGGIKQKTGDISEKITEKVSKKPAAAKEAEK